MPTVASVHFVDGKLTVAAFAGVARRTAEDWLQGEAGRPTDAVLASEDGRQGRTQVEASGGQDLHSNFKFYEKLFKVLKEFPKFIRFKQDVPPL